MTRNIIRTEQAPAPVGPYNQAVVANGMVFVAGQISIDPQTNTIVHSQDVTQQTEQVMANLEAILTAAGSSWDQVVKTTIFLADMADFGAVNQVYAQYFNLDTAPARACVEVSRLPKDVKVEIDCVAIVPNAS
jgi:2-iminobutanoate/2-iminopropanoate deaminase